MERGFLLASTFCFLLGLAYTMYALGARHFRPSKFNLGVIAAGFVFQSVFLYLRGQKVGACPVTNLFEVLIFLSWAVVLLYLVVGPAYRLSLLGAFTSPMVFVFQLFALLAQPAIDRPALMTTVRAHHSPLLELHAALSVMAYGAFALGCVAGVMYLVQERQLKSHKLHSIFFRLPPIHDLAAAIARLIFAGFALLTTGLFAGFLIGVPMLKVVIGETVWTAYAAILVAEWMKKISPRRVAIFSVAAFAFALATLSGLNLMGGGY